MADVPTTLTGLSALRVAVLGARPAAAAAPRVTAPARLIAPVGATTLLAGASVSGFGAASVRLVATVTSGLLALPASAPGATARAGGPDLAAGGPELVIEGDESAVNVALAHLHWTPAGPGTAELTLDVTPGRAASIAEHGQTLDGPSQVLERAAVELRAALPPAAPIVTEVETAGVGESRVRWQPPADDGGAPVLGYVVDGDPDGWCAVPATATACVLRGLVGGAAHTFRVAAISEVGIGSWSDPSPEVTPTDPSRG